MATKISQRKSFAFRELLPVARNLATILYERASITGVALTGSVARFERAHDIDLIVFHNGGRGAEDAIASHPPDASERELYAFHMKSLSDLLPWKQERKIKMALVVDGLGKDGQVPLNLICVHEKVLVDCSYLWSLEKLAHEEDFFNRLFCDIPLLLLNPATSRGEVKRLTWKTSCKSVAIGPRRIGDRVDYKEMGHRCDNKRCLPRKPWKVRKRERDRARLVASGNLPK